MATDSTRAVTDTFKDSAGREWRVRLNLAVLEAVHKETGVRLGEVMQGGDRLAAFLFGDPVAVGRAAWCCVAADAAARGVTRDEFDAAFDGSTLEAAAEAVLAAVADFFPRAAVSRQLRTDFRAVLDELDRRLLATAADRRTTFAAGPAGPTA